MRRLLRSTASLADSDLLGHGDLKMINSVTIPELFENRVGEPEHQNILYCFFSQIMVDAEHLVLPCVAG